MCILRAMALLKCPDCLSDVSDAALHCPMCGRTLAAGKSVRVRRVAFSGPGAWIQVLGALALFGGIGAGTALAIVCGVVALVGFVWLGRWMNRYHVCGKCGATVLDNATICHACRAPFLD